MDKINEWLGILSGWVWGPPLLVLLWFFLHAARRGDRSGEKR